MRYLLVDASNLYFRARHIAAKQSDTWEKLGLSLHLLFASMLKTWRQSKPDHVIVALEGRSWRKDVSSTYKKNREVAKQAMTELQAEEDKAFWETYGELTAWLDSSTNVTVARHERAEADDIIARWIALHPDDEHIICSTDSDFYQLLAPNVTIENGVTNQTIRLDGFFDERGRPVKDKKTGEHKVPGDPEWILFEKIMRGDSTDNVFSAYPGVRTKSSKSKVGLLEAFGDRNDKGYAWNNLMLQRWTDHNGEEQRVLDCYERNKRLIDLKEQPEDIKQQIDSYLMSIEPKNVTSVGGRLVKFCAKYELNEMMKHVNPLSELLNERLPK